MTDHPRFRKPKGDFEQVYREHHGAPLVDLALRTADACKSCSGYAAETRAALLRTVSVLFVLLCVLGVFAYAFAHKTVVGAAPLQERLTQPTSWAVDAPRHADQPWALPGKFTGYLGLYLP
jgi:hypothetical protein